MEGLDVILYGTDMIKERTRDEAEKFFEWDEGRTDYVTFTSCLLFADHMAKLEGERLRAECEHLKRVLRRTLLTYVVDDDAYDREAEADRAMNRAMTSNAELNGGVSRPT